MRAILLGTAYQLFSFLRVKKAFFFAFVFPTFVYVLFSLIWGVDNEDYSTFLLTGVLVLTTASDAMFSIGGVVSGYYRSGLIKFFKVTPYSFAMHVAALILSRVLIVAVSSIVVVVVAMLMSEVAWGASEVLSVCAGLAYCIYVYTFIALGALQFGAKESDNIGILNAILYGTIFLSNTIYPLSELNELLSPIVRINPITPALELARGEQISAGVVAWPPLLTIGYALTFKSKMQRVRR